MEDDGLEYLRKQLAQAKKAMAKLGDRASKAEKAERSIALENRKLRERLAWLESTFHSSGGTR